MYFNYKLIINNIFYQTLKKHHIDIFRIVTFFINVYYFEKIENSQSILSL